MKVKLTNKVHRFSIDTKQYYPGDVFEVTPEQFVGYFMEEIVNAPKPVLVEAVSEPKKKVVTKKAVEEVSKVEAEPTVAPVEPDIQSDSFKE